MAKKHDVKQDDLVSIKPITDNQKKVFEAWRKEIRSASTRKLEEKKLEIFENFLKNL